MSGFQYNRDPVVVDNDGVVELDEGANSDWTKQEWDLLGVTDVDSLRGYLAEVGQTAANFKASVTYKYGVKSQDWLRAAVTQLIREERTRPRI